VLLHQQQANQTAWLIWITAALAHEQSDTTNDKTIPSARNAQASDGG
jgi:hypothetical protein